ncbi:MAG TPA: hypothetical protein VLE97_04945 [Gaiellaceae bacterium]|nr:hypothetical protein [Gaiellaceae bacterium]
MRSALLLVAVFVIVAAGCGGGGSPIYTAAATAPCLKAKGFTEVTTNPLKVGFIASFATHGGLFAKAPGGNALTFSFVDDSDAATATESAYREHAPASLRPHIQDIMEAKSNAVLVWTVSPSQDQLSAALGCLRSS